MTVRWLPPVGELRTELAGPATHGRPGGRNPVAGPVFHGREETIGGRKRRGDPVADASDSEPDQQYPAHPERARLYTRARRINSDVACGLLVIQRDDGWSIHGLDLPGEGFYVPHDSMFLLAHWIVDRSPS
jgi:hypothetical protein